METKIINITKDGNVEFAGPEKYDGSCMTFDEFYNIMMKKIVSDYDNYNIKFCDEFLLSCDGYHYSVTYNGEKYQIKYDNKELNEVFSIDDLCRKSLMHDKSSSYWKKDRCDYYPDDDVDKLCIISAKQSIIDRQKKIIEKCNEQSKFFNKKRPLGFNDLNVHSLDFLAKVDVVMTIALGILNLGGFGISAIREFYANHLFIHAFSFIPIGVKFGYDLYCVNDLEGKKKNLSYYLFYPILYLASKENCKEDIIRSSKKIDEVQEEIDAFMEYDDIKRREKNGETIGEDERKLSCNHKYFGDHWEHTEPVLGEEDLPVPIFDLTGALKAAYELLDREHMEKMNHTEQVLGEEDLPVPNFIVSGANSATHELQENEGKEELPEYASEAAKAASELLNDPNWKISKESGQVYKKTLK